VILLSKLKNKEGSTVMKVSERKEKEKQFRNELIIDAAERVFFKKGFENTTMNDIAKEAGFSKGTIYLSFKHRQDLHFAIVLRAVKLIGTMLKRSYKLEGTPTEKLQIMLKAYITFTQKHPDYASVLRYFKPSDIKKVSPYYIEQFFNKESPLYILQEVLSELQDQGVIRVDIKPTELALILWSQISGILSMAYFYESFLHLAGTNPEKIIQNHINILLNGIFKTEPK